MSFGAVGLNNVYNYNMDVTTTSSISSIIPVYSQNLWNGRTNLLICLTVDWLADTLTDRQTDTVFCYRPVTTSHTARRKFARQRGIRCWHTTSPMPSFCVQYLGHVQFPRRMLKYATVDGAYHPLPWNRVHSSSITYCMNYTLFWCHLSSIKSLASPNFSSQRPLKAAEHCLESKHAKAKWLLMKS